MVTSLLRKGMGNFLKRLERKQVCSMKDASEGGDEVKNAESLDSFDIRLLVVSYLQVICCQESIYLDFSGDFQKISSPKALNGQRFPCPALLSPWFSWGEAGQRPR